MVIFNYLLGNFLKGGFGLNIEIHNQKLNKLFNNHEKLIQKIGLELAKKVIQRIN